jgi:ankyrin repeat protein
MGAAEENQLEAVLLLLKSGADINTRDNKGMTALTFASRKGNSQMVALLKAHGGKE